VTRQTDPLNFAVLVAVLLAILSPPAKAAEADDPLLREYEAAIAEYKARAEIPDERNAATYYLKAIEALPEDRTKDYDAFLPWTLIQSAPATVEQVPGSADEIRKYARAVEWLSRGALRQECAFRVEWERGYLGPYPHATGIHDLGRRVICYGKLLEHEGRPREAARVYLRAMTMYTHVGQNPGEAHLLMGLGGFRKAGIAIEGLLLRGVDATTAVWIGQRLEALPHPPFDFARAIDEERVLLGAAILNEFNRAADGGKETVMDLVAMIADGEGEAPDNPEDVLGEVLAAVRVFDRQSKALAEAAKLPYEQAMSEMRRLTEAHQAFWKQESEKRNFAAAFFGALSSMALPRLLEQTALVEARLNALAMLAAAALRKASRIGEYPESLNELAPLVPRKFRINPLTGSPLDYWLTPDGLPAVAYEMDAPEREEINPEDRHFGLWYRNRMEEYQFAKWRNARQRNAAAEDIALPENTGATADNGNEQP